MTTGKKTFNWLFDTGAAITCMNADSFRESFGHAKPKLLKTSAGCIAANGSRMESMGIYEIDMTIRGRKFVHPVTVVEDLNDQVPVMRSMDVAVDSGRGMHIIDKFADLWGYELTENGKRIWAGFTVN